MPQILNMPKFWTWQSSEYGKVLYMWTLYCVPAGIYLLIGSNRSTRTGCEIYSKLAIKTPERCQRRRFGVFIVNFQRISQPALMLLLIIWTCKYWLVFWICQNMPRQSSECILGSKYARILNMARFWICKSYTGFYMCHNMHEYVVIGCEYVWIYDNRQGSEYVSYNT